MLQRCSWTRMFRAHSKISSHFRIPSSGHLWPFLNRKILEIIRLFLWFRSIGIAKSDPNLFANSAKLFLSEPLESIIGNGLFIRISKGPLHPAYARIFAVVERRYEGLDVQ
jgi:hypothetical protein